MDPGLFGFTGYHRLAIPPLWDSNMMESLKTRVSYLEAHGLLSHYCTVTTTCSLQVTCDAVHTQNQLVHQFPLQCDTDFEKFILTKRRRDA